MDFQSSVHFSAPSCCTGTFRSPCSQRSDALLASATCWVFHGLLLRISFFSGKLFFGEDHPNNLFDFIWDDNPNIFELTSDWYFSSGLKNVREPPDGIPRPRATEA